MTRLPKFGVGAEAETMQRGDVTAFGARWAEPASVLVVLRARAARFDCELGSVDAIDAAAAVLGAEGWMSATGALTLEQPAGRGRPATAALAAVLRRAAGSGEFGETLTVAADAADADLETVSSWLVWLDAHKLDRNQVLLRVAYDLSAGADDYRLASMAAAAVVTAETT